jgi:hypothetical protein
MQGLQVPYVELGQRAGSTSPEEGCDLTAPNARRTLAVNWDDRHEAEWQIIGTSWLGETCQLHRWLPEQHPEKPWLWATRISRSYGVDPIGVTVMGTGFFANEENAAHGLQGSPIASTMGSGVSFEGHRSINTYRYCVFEVEYTRPPYNIAEDDDVGSEVERYVEYLPEFQGDYLSVPYEATSGATGLKFVETGRDFPGNVGVIVPAEIERLKWWQVPAVAVNETAIWELIGKVNSASFFDGQYSYAREHLLFCGLERERIWLPHDGSPGWNITFLFKWFKYGHNNFYDFYKQGAFNPAWRKATVGGGENDPTLYEYGDFSTIFLPNPEPCGSGSASWSAGSWDEHFFQQSQPDLTFSFSTK